MSVSTYLPPSLTRISMSMTVSVCLYAPLLSNPYLYKYDCVCLSLRPLLSNPYLYKYDCVCLSLRPLLSNPYLYKYDCVCLSLRPPPPSLTRICISMTVSVCLYVSPPPLSNPYLYKYDCVCLSLRPPPL